MQHKTHGRAACERVLQRDHYAWPGESRGVLGWSFFLTISIELADRKPHYGKSIHTDKRDTGMAITDIRGMGHTGYGTGRLSGIPNNGIRKGRKMSYAWSWSTTGYGFASKSTEEIIALCNAAGLGSVEGVSDWNGKGGKIDDELAWRRALGDGLSGSGLGRWSKGASQ